LVDDQQMDNRLSWDGVVRPVANGFTAWERAQANFAARLQQAAVAEQRVAQAAAAMGGGSAYVPRAVQAGMTAIGTTAAAMASDHIGRGLRRTYDVLADGASSIAGRLNPWGEPPRKYIKLENPRMDVDEQLPYSMSRAVRSRGRYGIGLTKMRHALECVEFKHYDADAADTTTNGTDLQFYPLDALNVGTANGQRVGRRIWLSSLQVSMCLRQDYTTRAIADNTSSLVMGLNYGILFVVGVDRLHQQAAGTAACRAQDLFDEHTDTFLSSRPPRNVHNMKRYLILRQKVVHGVLPFTSIGNSASFTLVPWARRVTWLIKFKKPLKIDYEESATGSAPGDVVTNYPFCLMRFQTDGTAIAADSLRYDFISRVFYTD